jgi:NADP-dependent 3-hydroxy acid dehydrogenase YdfG
VNENSGETEQGRPADRSGGGAGPLAGGVVLVTGASSGIGTATALAVVRQGGAVALVARRRERLEELSGSIAGQGGTAFVVEADLTDRAQNERAVHETVEHFGRLDVLVNNAGYIAPGPVEEGDLDDWDRMLDINVRALLGMSRAALPHLSRAAAVGPRGVADLVNVSSVAGRWPRKGNSVYSATKHAVVAFGEALRQEMAGRGVRVGLIEPGMTETEMTEGLRDSVGRGMAPHLWLRADDVARAITFMILQPAHAAINEIVVRPAAQEH